MAAPQTPDKSGFPLAARGVATPAACGAGGGAMGVRVQLGG